jgi:hypothetical protein
MGLHGLLQGELYLFTYTLYPAGMYFIIICIINYYYYYVRLIEDGHAFGFAFLYFFSKINISYRMHAVLL